MKTEEKLAPELHPVTWGNRVVTVLMIGVVWLFTLIWSGWAGDGWTLILFFKDIALVLGTHVASLGFLIALFAKNRTEQRWFRCFAWWSIFPGVLVGAGFTEAVQGVLELKSEPLWVSLIVQLFILISVHLVYFYLQKRKLKNGNINITK